MTTVATIQARMGSTRLPGKVLLPLGEGYVLEQVVDRVARADRIDAVVVATSTQRADDLIAQLAPSFGAQVHRGSETDVLARFGAAARAAAATHMVRITADCPYIDPAVIDAVIEHAVTTGADYTSNTLERSFPRGSSVEVCTMDSLATVLAEATEPHHREHVTPYYREHPERFSLASVTAADVFADPVYQGRTDCRITLDEADDYRLLRAVELQLPDAATASLPAVIDTIDAHGLASINAHVQQKAV